MRYKLTDANAKTFGGLQWGPGVQHQATGAGMALCSDGWIHCYDHPLLAVFFNPIGAAFDATTMRLWEFQPDESTEEQNDYGVSRGVRGGTTLREIRLPSLSPAQQVRAAILIAMGVVCGRVPEWDRWANDWLLGKERSPEAAWAVAESAAERARSAARDGAWSAESAAASAAAIARSAAASAAAIARSAAWSAEKRARSAARGAAWSAAASAAWSAESAAASAAKLDLVALIEQAIKEEPSK